ncbi:hypothetical protein C7H19_18085 [Aphanothece hegewaldii CCALA 016]|uniref:Uncharacterized protein n=1 Tax=Aphanothece hegewaldii CCALA 016 TaxID=2107694 RepID=A0A2T1LTZ4_9CHRO|nr:hypothetical protein C7H19_18085 [Aphanothece hegewaldii CCALA 016]
MDGQAMLRVKKAIEITNQKSLSVRYPESVIYKYLINVQQNLKFSYTSEWIREDAVPSLANVITSNACPVSFSKFNTNVCTDNIKCIYKRDHRFHASV